MQKFLQSIFTSPKSLQLFVRGIKVQGSKSLLKLKAISKLQPFVKSKRKSRSHTYNTKWNRIYITISKGSIETLVRKYWIKERTKTITENFKLRTLISDVKLFFISSPLSPVLVVNLFSLLGLFHTMLPVPFGRYPMILAPWYPEDLWVSNKLRLYFQSCTHCPLWASM